MQNHDGTYETPEQAFASPKDAHEYWVNAVDAAMSEEKKWRQDVEDAGRVYSGKTASAFNILHANTETIVPTVFNSVPVADVRPRYGDKNELARKAAQVMERGIEYEVDEYDLYAEMLRGVREYVLGGRGVLWLKYEPYTKQEEFEGIQYESITWQSVCSEFVPYDRFFRGPGVTWDDVPFVGRTKYLSKGEIAELAGEEIAERVPLDSTSLPDIDQDKDRAKKEKNVWKLAKVHEIWDKDTRKVWWIAPGFDEGPLAVEDDPYRLGDFFPCPRPMQTLFEPSKLVPIVPYRIYKAQADELAAISERLLKLVRIAKFRGLRAPEIPELGLLESLEDGEFAPVEEAMSILNAGGSLESAMWTMPLEALANVIGILSQQRDLIKQTIYESTGIADIMRGATAPSETLGAQRLKAQFGSNRVQPMQAEVARFCRDLYRLKAEIIAEHFTPQVLSIIAGEQVDEQVLQLLKNDTLRRFLVDIETESTIQADKAKNRQEMSEFLNSTASFFQVMAPVVDAGVVPPTVPIAIYGSFARSFNLGKEVEDILAEMTEQAPQYMQQKEGERKQQQQMGQQREQAETEKIKAEAMKAMKEAQTMPEGNEGLVDDAARFQLDQERIQLDREKMVFEREKANREAELKERQLAQDSHYRMLELAQQREIEEMRIDAQKRKVAENG